MLVKQLMSKPVISVLDTSTVGEAMELLKEKNIRHLPVVDRNQNLVGIVTETDLLRVFPNIKGLSTFQSNLLARTPIQKIMQKPAWIAPDIIVEEAALSMRTNKVSCLPVLDSDNKLVGLLTKNDIIDAFIAALGLGESGTRIAIVYKKKWGFLSELISFADQHNIFIDNIVTFGPEIVLKVKGNSTAFFDDLKKAGYTVGDVSFINPAHETKNE
ncbi:MAG: CBS domain-containing protein [Thermincola sp.]|jgi:acetoin utilization protein AcuB|nr:CBS domain-containing protein [Thermincola sp.]